MPLIKGRSVHRAERIGLANDRFVSYGLPEVPRRKDR
jgi:hypothetical protein